MPKTDGMVVPSVFRLTVGEPAPLQQSRVSCGAACLTVARMLVEPGLASWVVGGVGTAPFGCAGSTPAERFGSHECAVLARTNAVRPGRNCWQAPWPRALGTPPWGATWELEHGAATAGPYGIDVVRMGITPAAAELVGARVRPGAPTLLYVGDDALPRHVVLVFTTGAADAPGVYDPGSGRVRPYCPSDVATGTLALSGWNRAWFTVRPLAATLGRAAGAHATRPRAWWPTPARTADPVTRSTDGV